VNVEKSLSLALSAEAALTLELSFTKLIVFVVHSCTCFECTLEL